MLFNKILDISEADLVYTETLMQRGKENYEGKEIVILGKISSMMSILPVSFSNDSHKKNIVVTVQVV